ncbi:MAG: DNA primase DnaG [archaeon]|jgi:DNA primase
MAKTYLSAVKYEILANYEVQGVVEKPDIVGAIFGQCEGLLGEDMDLKELQQSGKIGRIEITVKKGKGTTSGEVVIPSSLDQVKTSILAATVETVEKVGPFEAKVKVMKIQDTRKEKRETITDRAKELLKHMQQNEGAMESGELADTIKSEVRSEKIVNFRNLPAGPEVETSPEIIVVEGRADVLKLLSYGINNAVAMNGGNIDTPLIQLCKEKEVTVLIDGDRGGELNAKKLASLTKVDFIARAPDGKEVEELMQKEILQALKKKVVLAEAFNQPSAPQSFAPSYDQRPRFEPRNNFGGDRGYRPNNFGNDRPNFGDRRPSFGNDRRPQFGNDRGFRPNNFGNDRPNFSDRRPQFGDRRPSFGNDRPFQPRREFNNFRGPPTSEMGNSPQPFNPVQREESVPKEILDMKKEFDKLKGKSKARMLDEKNKKIKDVEVKDLLDSLTKQKKKVHAIMFDGIITNRLVEAAEAKGVGVIIGVKKGQIAPQKVKAYTL